MSNWSGSFNQRRQARYIPGVFARLAAWARNWLSADPGLHEILRAVLRLLLFLLTLLMFITIGGYAFESVDTRQIVTNARNAFFPLKLFNFEFEQFMVFVFSWDNFRYALPPIFAMGVVLMLGARYVQDIYDLRNLWDGMRYVTASLFGLFYPRLFIDNGKPVLAPRERNLLIEIGGPGYIMIQPGNVVLFRRLRAPIRVTLVNSFMMARFEEIGQIASLDDQHGCVTNIEMMTLDGIRVNVRDIEFRYMIGHRDNARPISRTQNSPYPFSGEDIERMANNLPVGENREQISWEEYVRMQVVREIESYVNAHTIDHLTAPRGLSTDPREEIRQRMSSPEFTRILNLNGTRLLWVDVGHFDIIQPEVDQERIGVWAAEWVGNANIERAFGEAKRLTWQEQGRAEGQAEIILSIAEALREVPLGGNQPQTMRAVLMARLSQVLVAMRDTRPAEDA